MSDLFLKKVTLLGVGLCLAASLAFAAAGQWAGFFGVWVSAFWVFLNGFILFQLLRMAMKQGAQKSNKIFVFLMIKFPVLYLAGFFILQSRIFPVSSLLTGMTLFFLSFIAGWARFQLKTAATTIVTAFFFVHQALASESHGGGHAETSGQHGGDSGGSLHTTNLVGLIADKIGGPAGETLKSYENLIFGILVILILSLIFYFASRKMAMVPGRLQSACESVVEGLDGFVCGIIGSDGKKYTPFLGTLFLYILTMNLIGLVPLMKSNTANSITLTGPVALPVPTTTVALAIIVFIMVQSIGIKKQGILGYLDHMAGSPRDAFGYVMAPLMFPIHLIGEFAKPFSLTFRLFCNIMGGHILVAVFIGMGIAASLIPFQAPFLLFEIATSTIQAFVFTLLSTVYIAMMLPHEHPAGHEHGHETSAH